MFFGSKRPRQSASDPPGARGREKLIDAVVQLGSTARSLASLGLREVAREAGLNPNTFYRHFRDFDDLGVAVIERVSAQLRSALRERRRRPLTGRGLEGASPEDLKTIVRESVTLVFDFVSQNGALVVIAIRELHGNSAILRKALREVVDALAREMAEDAVLIGRLEALDAETVHELSRMVIRQMCFLSLEYIERPNERQALRREAERFILLLFWGALAMETMDDLPSKPARLASSHGRQRAGRR
jgi:AcrR family transcriptional regulator